MSARLHGIQDVELTSCSSVRKLVEFACAIASSIRSHLCLLSSRKFASKFWMSIRFGDLVSRSEIRASAKTYCALRPRPNTLPLL